MICKHISEEWRKADNVIWLQLSASQQHKNLNISQLCRIIAFRRKALLRIGILQVQFNSVVLRLTGNQASGLILYLREQFVYDLFDDFGSLSSSWNYILASGGLLIFIDFHRYLKPKCLLGRKKKEPFLGPLICMVRLASLGSCHFYESQWSLKYLLPM